MKKIIAFITVFLKNTGEKIQQTHPVAQIAAFLVCVGLMAVLLLSVVFHSWTDRAVFYYPVVGKKNVHTEIRYIPHVKGQDARLSLFVSELLLGPGEPGMLPLYEKNTSLIQAFVRKGSAYVNISAEALSPIAPIVDQERAFSLFKKNVCTNFRNIDKLYLYIDGIEVYSRNTIEDAVSKNKKR